MKRKPGWFDLQKAVPAWLFYLAHIMKYDAPISIPLLKIPRLRGIIGRA